MTENKAIKDIQFLARRYDDLQEVNMSVSQESLDMAIQALEEIQQYRAIGTVEQLKTMFDGFWKLKDLCEEYEKYGLPEDYWKLNETCKEYSAIGTVKEIKIREAQFKRLSEGYLNDLSLLREYESIGTIDEFKALKEKNEPKKPNAIDEKMEENFYYLAFTCPTCGSGVIGQPYRPNNCKHCGQKLYWQ